MAATLARDSLQAHGGNLRATFIKAFGCAPDELELLASPTSQMQASLLGMLLLLLLLLPRNGWTRHLAGDAVTSPPAACEWPKVDNVSRRGASEWS